MADRVYKEADIMQEAVLRRRAPVLGNSSVLQLMDEAAEDKGGQRYSDTVQLKPSNFVRLYNVPMKGSGFDAKAAGREGEIAAEINGLRRSGKLDSRKSFVGGHLLKAEFGGEDNAHNVVPWSAFAENEYSAYEDYYTRREMGLLTEQADYGSFTKRQYDIRKNFGHDIRQDSGHSVGEWLLDFYVQVMYHDRSQFLSENIMRFGYEKAEADEIAAAVSRIPFDVFVNVGAQGDSINLNGEDIIDDLSIRYNPDRKAERPEDMDQGKRVVEDGMDHAIIDCSKRSWNEERRDAWFNKIQIPRVD